MLCFVIDDACSFISHVRSVRLYGRFFLSGATAGNKRKKRNKGKDDEGLIMQQGVTAAV